MKKRLRGLTLMEVIVALAIYAILALLTTEIMTLVNATMYSTTHLNRRLAYESKSADTLNVAAGAEKNEAFNPQDAGAPAEDKLTVEWTGGSKTVDHAAEYAAQYPGESSDDVKTNYHFLVVEQNEIHIGEMPAQPFILRLVVDIGERRIGGSAPDGLANVESLDAIYIQSDGQMAAPDPPDPATGGFTEVGSINVDGVGSGIPCFSYIPANNTDEDSDQPFAKRDDANTNREGDEEAYDGLEIKPEDLGIVWENPFCIDIPLLYPETVTDDDNGIRTINVTLRAHIAGDHYDQSNTTYDRALYSMKLTYCTAMQTHDQITGESVWQYFGTDNKLGTSPGGSYNVGASYILHSDGNLEVQKRQ